MNETPELDHVVNMKTVFRMRQDAVPVEEKIRQLLAMQRRHMAISKAAIDSGLKKPSDEFIRARRLLGVD
ncbi:MAG: hypothetical protein ABI791_14195 [Acidobacteriota bacterium]